MRTLDLFSGIGAFAIAAERTGFTTTQFVEINQFCQDVLKTRFPDIPIHSDIKDFHASEGQYDIICGGFPCQDIAVGNPFGLGLDGDRSGLWSEFNRVISEVKPKYVIIENSPNLRNRGMQRVLKDLWESGYDAEWYCFQAGQFGASHVRDRIFIIAYPTGQRVERLIKNEYLKEIGQRRFGIPQDLLDAIRNPFERSSSYPKPLICRSDDEFSGRVDRLKAIGNSIYLDIPEFIFKCIKREQ